MTSLSNQEDIIIKFEQILTEKRLFRAMDILDRGKYLNNKISLSKLSENELKRLGIREKVAKKIINILTSLFDGDSSSSDDNLHAGSDDGCSGSDAPESDSSESRNDSGSSDDENTCSSTSEEDDEENIEMQKVLKFFDKYKYITKYADEVIEKGIKTLDDVENMSLEDWQAIDKNFKKYTWSMIQYSVKWEPLFLFLHENKMLHYKKGLLDENIFCIADLTHLSKAVMKKLKMKKKDIKKFQDFKKKLGIKTTKSRNTKYDNTNLNSDDEEKDDKDENKYGNTFNISFISNPVIIPKNISELDILHRKIWIDLQMNMREWELKTMFKAKADFLQNLQSSKVNVIMPKDNKKKILKANTISTKSSKKTTKHVSKSKNTKNKNTKNKRRKSITRSVSHPHLQTSFDNSKSRCMACGRKLKKCKCI